MYAEKENKQVKKCDRKSHFKNLPVRMHFRTHSSRPFSHALPHAHCTCGSAIIRTCAPQPNIWFLSVPYFWISYLVYEFLYDAIIPVCSCLFLSVPVCSCLFLSVYAWISHKILISLPLNFISEIGIPWMFEFPIWYRISSYSFHGNYFLNLEIQRSQYIRPKVTHST
jgi:hypothetical protein